MSQNQAQIVYRVIAIKNTPDESGAKGGKRGAMLDALNRVLCTLMRKYTLRIFFFHKRSFLKGWHLHQNQGFPVFQKVIAKPQ